jgi:hypothetical protein
MIQMHTHSKTTVQTKLKSVKIVCGEGNERKAKERQ